MKFDWQYLVAFVILAGAVYYVVKSFRKSLKGDHDCPECETGKTIKKSQPKV
ncbi:MAG: hypothetical protein NTX03_11225 [Bacteroidetes bacterium]|nr:hypothetical protein [Bacteroidota bacterium]